MTAATFYGYNPPFVGGAQNVLSRQEDERLIRNDILQLLLTVPGERVMRPDFGVNLRNTVFEPSDATMVVALEEEIRQKIQQYDERVIVDDVQIATDVEDHGMTIRVFMRLQRNPAQRVDVEQFIKFLDSQYGQ